jgi:hypothetical protein
VYKKYIDKDQEKVRIEQASKKLSASAKLMRNLQIRRIDSILGKDTNQDQQVAKSDICALDTKMGHNLLDVLQELATNKLKEDKSSSNEKKF